MNVTDRSQPFAALLAECLDTYLTTPAGQHHRQAFAHQRAAAQEHLAQLTRLDAQGVDITDLVLRKLLPHSDTEAHRQQGTWISLAASISGDLRTWYEAAGMTRSDRWPAVARALWEFVRRTTAHPDELAAACADFAAQPATKGFQTGMVTPILNALRPDHFLLVNQRTRAGLNYFSGSTFGPALVDYPATNAALQSWLDAQPELQQAATARAMLPGDLYDLVCHWLVGARRFAFRPPTHWRITLDEDPTLWAEWQEGQYIALGYDALGDISAISQAEFNRRRDSLLDQYAAWRKSDLNQVWALARRLHEGDAVLVTDRRGRVLGQGTIAGPYYFVAEGGLGHRRLVGWDDVSLREAGLPASRGLVKLGAATFATAMAAAPIEPPTPVYVPHPQPATALHEQAPVYAAPAAVQPPYALEAVAEATGLDEATLGEWVQAIERKGQAILYGPPGTGKTFVAHHLARHLVGDGDGFSEVVQFHPAYSYEDFVQGLRPSSGGGLHFTLTPGRFLTFCSRAAGHTGRCVLIIDEINRANLPQVLGELFYLLEYRDAEVRLAGGTPFSIPANVRILGTMNTADRSLAWVDHALRRRFAFLPLTFNPTVLRRFHAQGDSGFPVEPLIQLLSALNAAIGDPNLALGHSYFLRGDLTQALPNIWQYEIEPYLAELFFDRPDELVPWRWEAVAAALGIG